MAENVNNIGDIQKKIEELNNEQKENSLVKQLRGSLDQAKGFLLEELIKIGTASENKTIDVNDENVKQVIQSLIYADPNGTKNKASGNGALSILVTIKNNEKQIAKWEKEGYNSKAFEGIKEEMEKLPKELEAELSTQKGIDNLINEHVKNNILKQIPFVSKEQQGIRGLNTVEKNNVINKINQNIKISPNIVSTLLQNESLLQPLIRQIIKTASEFFGKEGVAVNNACVLDEKKLTTKNVHKFTEATNHNVKIFDYIQQSFKSMESDIDITQNKKITEALLPVISKLIPEKLQQNGTKIIKNIAPILKERDKLAEITKSALSKLDTDYIIKYNDTIIKGLQEVNNKGVSIWENFKSVFTGQDYLKDKLEQVVDSHILESNKYITNKITSFSSALKNNELVVGLTNFINENKNALTNNPKFQNINPNEIHNNKSVLVELRKINPLGFDKIVFEDSKLSASKNSIVNSVGFAYKEQGAKPTNKRATSNVVGESKSIDSKPQAVKVKPSATPNRSINNKNRGR